MARIVVAPLDILKIRLQLQVSPEMEGTRTSMRTVTRALLKEEGVRTLWRGNVAAMILWVSYSGIQFPAYRLCKQWMKVLEASPATGGERPTLIPALAAGALSGCIATVATYPFDWLRTRWASQGVPKRYATMWDLVRSEVSQHGVQVCFRGLAPTLVSVAPQLAVTFGTYEQCGHVYDVLTGTTSTKDGAFRAAFAGACAGTLGKLVVYPLDTVKKRLQVPMTDAARNIQQQPEASPVNTTWRVLTHMWKHEGVWSWYKGVAPSVLKASGAAAITFTVYEAAATQLTLWGV